MPTLLSPVHVSSLHEPKTERKFPTPDLSRPNPLSPSAYLYATARAQAPLSVESLIAEEEKDASRTSSTQRMYHRYRCERQSCRENSETSRSSSVVTERSMR